MNKYEYKAVGINYDSDDFTQNLNVLGSEGWELVSVVGIERKNLGLFDSGSETKGMVAFLKRPIED
jgi:hypothetical protein